MDSKAAPVVVMRQPSTANLMLDSADRDETRYPLANDFQITKSNSILNGFFTRIGTSEVVLEWSTPNISAALGNNTLVIDISGAGAATGSGTFDATLPDGFYTQEQILYQLAVGLNDAATGAPIAPAVTFTAAASTGFAGAVITPSAPVYLKFPTTILSVLLGLPTTYTLYGPTDAIEFVAADLRPLRYIDFVSSQLTYNQELKDSSTSPQVRDVLCRWYFAWDEQPQLDGFGFPILMGYAPFQLRRTFSPPKQIKWDSRQPLGNITFQLYNDRNEIVPVVASTNWLMTLQVSEN